VDKSERSEDSAERFVKKEKGLDWIESIEGIKGWPRDGNRMARQARDERSQGGGPVQDGGKQDVDSTHDHDQN